MRRIPVTEDEFWEQRDERIQRRRDDESLNPQPRNPMMIKRYLEHLVHLCSDQVFGQEAVEWAITSGHVKLTFNLEADLRTIMGEPGQPDTGQYSSIIEAYQAVVRGHEEILVGVYAESGLLEEIMRQVPESKAV